MNEITSIKNIKEKAFANRLGTACENHPHAPSGHGRQRWLRDEIFARFAIKVSAESVRKWFAGESRPRPKIMTKIAEALEVDEAWLALGLTPAPNPREKQKINAMANGALNLVAGQVQLAGGSIAFSEEGSDNDLFVIMRGVQYPLAVRLGTVDPSFKVYVPPSVKNLIIVVPTDQPTNQRFVTVTSAIIIEDGRRHGGFQEIEVERSGAKLTVGGKALAEIKSFAELASAFRSTV